jgi:hypothetical protein
MVVDLLHLLQRMIVLDLADENRRYDQLLVVVFVFVSSYLVLIGYSVGNNTVDGSE